MRRLLLLLVPVLALAACMGGDGEYENWPQGNMENVKLRVLAAGDTHTRSSVGAAEDGINNLLILFYEDGLLLPELTVSRSAAGVDSLELGVSLGIGHEFDVVSFANCTVSPAPQTLAEARALCYNCDGISGWSGGIPMAAYKLLKIRYAMPAVEVQLVRLVAKLDLTIDTSSLQHGSINFTSVAVRQMNCRCPFFNRASADPDGGVCDGDAASASDLAVMNAGQKATFYLLENMQGDLLAGNTNPDLKTPASLSSRGYDPGLCTYLEICGTYSDRSGNLTSDSLLSHLYLGSDALGNFDLERNHRYEVDVTITDNGCLRTDWKINGYLDDRRRLQFAVPELEAKRTESVTAVLNTNLSLAQGDYSYSVSGNTASFTVVPVSSGFRVTPLSTAEDKQYIDITVVSWDGALRSVCRVKVDEPRFTVDWANNLYVGQTGTIHITDRLNMPLEGHLLLYTGGYIASVDGYGDTWVVSGIGPGEESLAVCYDHNVIQYIRVDIAQPVMSFVSDDISLPLDGSPVEVGPYYYRKDGTRLYYEDFDPGLYQTYLGFTLTRSPVNPNVSVADVGTDHVSYAFRISNPSAYLYPGVELERIRAELNYHPIMRLSAEAVLYTGYP
ncbi:MAG: DUF4906 domain-containing protein [Bacteroidales bacterium]|nr:DUF4906 domain-containing protein [Bacteroidales bacterium]